MPPDSATPPLEPLPVTRRLAHFGAWAQRHQTALSLGIGLVVLLAAGFALAHLLRGIAWLDVRQALGELGAVEIALAVGLTTASYLVLSGYDKLALRAIGQRQPWPVCALAAFTSYTLSHNLGFAPITGGAARWRVYGPRGMAFADVARIVVIAGVTFWLGVFLVMGVALVAAPGALRIDDWVAPYGLQAAMGATILLGIAGYLTMTAFRPRPLALLGWSLPVPSFGQAVAQFALAAAEIALATAALAVLVPGATLADYPDFVIAYVMAMVVALISHTPGGLGVFEAVIIVAMPDVDRAGLVSALIAYRLIYYLIPLALALLLLGGIEVRGRATASTADR